MALDDLLRCRRYCEMMLKLPIGKAFTNERTIYESLFVSFVVSYGRVFTTSNTVDRSFKESVSNDFGQFRQTMIKKQDTVLEKFHKRIIEKRDTSIAHSDGKSRNYQHYGDSPLPCGSNPFYPYEHTEIEQAIKLVNNLISMVGDEQIRVGKVAFSKTIFSN
ncbi:hypothetical protein [Shewanella ulleungensis]|jgi:hypothetical protein|nr:hypothetical protein [Shewanella ulleungensis]